MALQKSLTLLGYNQSIALPSIESPAFGADQRTVFAKGNIAIQPIPVWQMWYPIDEERVRLGC